MSLPSYCHPLSGWSSPASCIQVQLPHVSLSVGTACPPHEGTGSLEALHPTAGSVSGCVSFGKIYYSGLTHTSTPATPCQLCTGQVRVRRCPDRHGLERSQRRHSQQPQMATHCPLVVGQTGIRRTDFRAAVRRDHVQPHGNKDAPHGPKPEERSQTQNSLLCDSVYTKHKDRRNRSMVRLVSGCYPLLPYGREGMQDF